MNAICPSVSLKFSLTVPLTYESIGGEFFKNPLLACFLPIGQGVQHVESRWYCSACKPNNIVTVPSTLICTSCRLAKEYSMCRADGTVLLVYLTPSCQYHLLSICCSSCRLAKEHSLWRAGDTVSLVYLTTS